MCIVNTTTTTPSVIPLTRGLGRSECSQPYPSKYHYSQRGRFQHVCIVNTGQNLIQLLIILDSLPNIEILVLHIFMA